MTRSFASPATFAPTKTTLSGERARGLLVFPYLWKSMTKMEIRHKACGSLQVCGRDPFFLDLANLGQTLALPRITELENKIGADLLLGPITGSKNYLHGKDVLSIVIEADIDKLFGSGGGSLFAVVGEVYISGEEPVRVDRQGRSEMTNITLGRMQSDEVNPNLEIRDWYKPGGFLQHVRGPRRSLRCSI